MPILLSKILPKKNPKFLFIYFLLLTIVLFHIIHLFHRKFMFPSVLAVSKNINKKLRCMIILSRKFSPPKKKKISNNRDFLFGSRFTNSHFYFIVSCDDCCAIFSIKSTIFPYETPLTYTVSNIKFEYLYSRYILVSTAQFYFETLYIYSVVLIC